MGWGGNHNHNTNRPGQKSQQVLVKEQQVANQTLRATFPSAEAGKQVRFELQLVSNDSNQEDIFSSASLEIRRNAASSDTNNYTKISPDPSLSTRGLWVFSYRFYEPGDYNITFIIDYQFQKQSVNTFTISANRPVSESYAIGHRYNSLPWIAGGIVMTGMMIWMITD